MSTNWPTEIEYLFASSVEILVTNGKAWICLLVIRIWMKFVVLFIFIETTYVWSDKSKNWQSDHMEVDDSSVEEGKIKKNNNKKSSSGSQHHTPTPNQVSPFKVTPSYVNGGKIESQSGLLAFLVQQESVADVTKCVVACHGGPSPLSAPRQGSNTHLRLWWFDYPIQSLQLIAAAVSQSMWRW